MSAELRDRTPPDAERGLESAARRAADDAERTGSAQLVVLRAPVEPGDALAFAELGGSAEAFVCERPVEATACAARGALRAIEVAGEARFATAAGEARALFAALHVAGDSAPACAGPLLVGGFAFADAAPGPDWPGFAPGRLVLPRALYVRRGDAAWLSVARELRRGDAPGALCAALRGDLARERARLAASGTAPAAEAGAADTATARLPEFRAIADRPHADYLARVRRALRAIAAGELEKVVVARSLRLEACEPQAPAAVLASLRRTHPACASFAIARPGGADAVFLGATPERLLRLDGRALTSAALAGSAPRGRSPEEDAALGRALLESKKEQAEHASVVRALRDALTPLASELTIPEAPRLLRLDGIQHLETPVRARLASDVSVLELAARLHPTPAVGGAPREAALAWLAAHEALDRGWYGGAVGFVDAAGGGELVVALRCGLFGPRGARLFAGAGIVAESEPEHELAETRLKLRALLGPLLEI